MTVETKAVANIDAANLYGAGAEFNDIEQPEADWTREEEKRLIRRCGDAIYEKYQLAALIKSCYSLDSLVMPLLMLAFFALQLDRGNIGNALTDFFLRDVHITQNQYNVGQQLLSLGIVLLEVPSNYVLYRIGPTVWISGQVIAWSLVATFQAFQHGLGPYLATRLLLGLCESGFIPAGLYTITRWYKRDESSKRFSWFFIGNMLAQAVSGLVAYGILQMRGIAGLAGWQWLFIIEGLFGIVVGALFISLFPRDVRNPVSIFRYHYFSKRETEILVRRLLLDDPTKAQRHRNITKEEILRAFKNWRIYPHVFLTISGLAPSSTLWSYAPTLVKGFGYERLKSNAMVSVGQWMQLVVNVSWGVAADKLGLRGPLVLAGMILWWAFALANRLCIYSDNNHTRYAILILGITFSGIWHPVNGSWMALNARSAGERSITLAIFIMSANTSGIVGSQLFQAEDAPAYRIGWTTIVALVSLALFLTTFANVQYWVSNYRIRRDERSERADGTGTRLYSL